MIRWVEDPEGHTTNKLLVASHWSIRVAGYIFWRTFVTQKFQISTDESTNINNAFRNNTLFLIRSHTTRSTQDYTLTLLSMIA